MLSELPRALATRAPELKEALEAEAAFWAEIGVSPLGPDAAFDGVLAPYVLERLETDDSGEDEVLRRIFGFLEELADPGDEVGLSAVYVSFGEAVLDSLDTYHNIQPYLGPRLREGFEYLYRCRNLG